MTFRRLRPWRCHGPYCHTVELDHGLTRVSKQVGEISSPGAGCQWRMTPRDLALLTWALDKLNLVVEIVKRNADVAGFRVLPRRWVVERTFAWLTRSHRLARDYEERPQPVHRLQAADAVHAGDRPGRTRRAVDGPRHALWEFDRLRDFLAARRRLLVDVLNTRCSACRRTGRERHAPTRTSRPRTRPTCTPTTNLARGDGGPGPLRPSPGRAPRHGGLRLETSWIRQEGLTRWRS